MDSGRDPGELPFLLSNQAKAVTQLEGKRYLAHEILMRPSLGNSEIGAQISKVEGELKQVKIRYAKNNRRFLGQSHRRRKSIPVSFLPSSSICHNDRSRSLMSQDDLQG
jgi:hypothetical protein